MLDWVVGELYSYEIVEEHPLMRVELCDLHQRDHFYEFEGCPMLVELILDGGGVEGFGEKEDDVLPDG